MAQRKAPPQTKAADLQLVDALDEKVCHGWWMARDLPAVLLDVQGDQSFPVSEQARWASKRYTAAQARENVREFARWLLDVADRAR